MFYAQKNYNQKLGTGDLTIEQAGCLLTAICNRLVMDFGLQVDPPTLNQWFIANGAYVKDSTGLDALAWNSITRYKPEEIVSQIINGAMPSGAVAIVKFHYQSVQTPTIIVGDQEIPNMIDHFCAVNRIQNGQLYIVDSWDGLVKAPTAYQGTYHAPIAWCVYSVEQPAPAAAPAPAPVLPANPSPTLSAVSAAPLTVPKVLVAYPVGATIPGYTTATAAGNNVPTPYIVMPGTYYVWSTYPGKAWLKNVTKDKTLAKAGDWINCHDNPADTTYYTPPAAAKAAAPPAPVQTTTDNIKTPASTPNVPQTIATGTATAPNWRSSYKRFPAQPTNYIAMESFVVHDLSGTYPDLTCSKYELCPLAGAFVGPDDVTYGRTMKSVFPNLRSTPQQRQAPPQWYGLPFDDKHLRLESDLFSTDTSLGDRLATNSLNLFDKLALVTGKLAGWLERLGNKQAVK